MKEFINEILSSPFGLILESILGIIIFALVVLSKTKFGKKMLIELATKIATNEKKVDKKVEELDAAKKEIIEKHEKTEKEIELKLAEERVKFEKLEKFLLNALGSINNVNVKKAIENYEKLKAEQLTDNYEKVGYNGQKD